MSFSGRPLFTKVVTVDCFRNSWVLLTSWGENCGNLYFRALLLGFASHACPFAAFILNLLAVVVPVIIFWIALDSLAGFLYVSTVSPLCLAHDCSASVLESRFWWTAGVLDTLGKNVLQEGADAHARNRRLGGPGPWGGKTRRCIGRG